MDRVLIRGVLRYAAFPLISAIVMAVVLLSTDFWRPQTPEVVIWETHAHPFDGSYVVYLQVNYKDGSECICTFTWTGTQKYSQVSNAYSAFLEPGERVTVSVTANKYDRGGRPSHASIIIKAPLPGDESIRINRVNADMLTRYDGNWVTILELGVSTACQGYTVTWWDNEGNEIPTKGAGTSYQYGYLKITEPGTYLTSYQVKGCGQSLSGTKLVNTKELLEG